MLIYVRDHSDMVGMRRVGISLIEVALNASFPKYFWNK